MNGELIVSIAGVVLSLLFSYVPGLQGWFKKLDGNSKRLVMLALMALVSLGAFGLACLGRYDLVACTTDGGWQMLEYFVWAVIANQTAYLVTPK